MRAYLWDSTLGLGLLLLLLLASGAQAQRDPPSDLELRTAYCISVLGGRSTDARTRSSLPGPRSQQEALRDEHAGYERDLRRLRAYLLPRTKYLDAAALLAATDRGQADVAAFLQAQQACKARCDSRPSPSGDAAAAAACVEACAAREPAAERVGACKQ
jgi:hypothetical protein